MNPAVGITKILLFLAARCKSCATQLDERTRRPSKDTFDKYVSFFLNDNPDDSCAIGGHGAYGQVTF